jgi:sterol desaturase/sphingolipid hydroxylase (fatty acid hydroxylase superfamily)
MEHEATIRLGMFLGLFMLFAALERVAPKHAAEYSVRSRWLTNFSISILNTLLLRALALALPFLAVGAAIDASAMGWGLFNVIDLPLLLEAAICILLLDFIIWIQHVLTHKIPFLWRLHRVHHADVDFDVSTAIRFHPIEIALSMILKIGVVYVLGPAAWAVVAFEILLNGTALFNHANLAMPAWLDRWLRYLIVTPDMHRIHHSVKRDEHDSNYGFALSIWDRIFSTYFKSELSTNEKIVVGLEWQDQRPTKLGWSLWLPFMRK